MRSHKTSKRAALLASIAASALIVCAVPGVSEAGQPKGTNSTIGRPKPEDPTPPPAFSFVPGIRW